MIHSFSCKNFYSFKEEAVVSFVVNKQAPDNEGYFIAPSGVRLSKVGVVIGPNASGKTNLLKVIPFLRWLSVTSFSKLPDNPIPVKPFKFSGMDNRATELSVTFEVEGQIYLYAVTVDENKIISESLSIKGKLKIRNTAKELFSRVLHKTNDSYSYKFHKSFNPPAGLKGTIRPNTTLIATAIHLNHPLSQKIVNFWKQVETNAIGETGYVNNIFINSALAKYEESPDLKLKMETLLSKYDIGFSKLNISKEKSERGNRFNAMVLHTVGDHEEELPIKYESSGTQRLIYILGRILASLQNGSPAIIDEIDVNLHPEMVAELVGLYLHPETNPRNAQLLTSTHSHQLLSQLDKYQIILTEKNKAGSTETWRLDEMDGIRSDDNYFTKYMAGVYGATPKIDI